jgi:hypothetical protein
VLPSTKTRRQGRSTPLAGGGHRRQIPRLRWHRRLDRATRYSIPHLISGLAVDKIPLFTASLSDKGFVTISCLIIVHDSVH